MPNIILTCGPSCKDEKILKRMSVIADGFRLNTAHLSQDELEWWLNCLIRLQNNADRPFTLFVDLQGAKIRIGSYPSCMQIPSQVELFLGEASDDKRKIPVTAASVFKAAETGDLLLLNDRRVILRVTKRVSNECLMAETVKNGPLSSKKGLNSADKMFEFMAPSKQELNAIRLFKNAPINCNFAVSYVFNGQEADVYRRLIGPNAKLTAKIEHPAAVKNLKKIIKSGFGALWLCRGDMGANAGLKSLGRVQNEFIAEARGINAPIILAGEVLGSMTALPYPSRAEVVQLYNALSQGFSGIVLSDETACGSHVEDVLDFIEYYFDKNNSNIY